VAKVYQDKRVRKNGGLRPWCVSYVGLDGKRHREKTPASTKEEAQAILRKRMSEITKAKLTDAPSVEALKPVSFEEFVKEEYLPHCKATHTVSTYSGNMKFAKAVMPTFGRKLLRSITTGDIQKFVDQRAHRVLRYGKVEGGKKIPIIAKPATTNRDPPAPRAQRQAPLAHAPGGGADSRLLPGLAEADRPLRPEHRDAPRRSLAPQVGRCRL
jgi:hypothetical protein